MGSGLYALKISLLDIPERKSTVTILGIIISAATVAFGSGGQLLLSASIVAIVMFSGVFVGQRLGEDFYPLLCRQSIGYSPKAKTQ